MGLRSHLHLVEPLGFDIGEKAVRRAGLDYWKHVDLCVHPNWDACKAAKWSLPAVVSALLADKKLCDRTDRGELRDRLQQVHQGVSLSTVVF